MRHMEEMKKMKQQFREDIIIIDKELTKQINQRKEATMHIEQLQKANSEKSVVIQAAALSDEKKSAMLEELKVVVRNEREALAQKQSDLQKDRSQLDEYKRMKEDENLQLKKQLDDKIFEIKELKMKLENMTTRYSKLEDNSKVTFTNLEELSKEEEGLRKAN